MDELSSEAEGKRSLNTSTASAPAKTTPVATTPVAEKPKSAYVNSLMDEAEGMTVDKSGSVPANELQTIEKTTDASWNYDEQTLGTCVPGLSHAEFEKNLKRNYFGTYALYQKLDPIAKSMVFKAYQSDPNIEHITKVISDFVK